MEKIAYVWPKPYLDNFGHIRSGALDNYLKLIVNIKLTQRTSLHKLEI